MIYLVLLLIITLTAFGAIKDKTGPGFEWRSKGTCALLLLDLEQNTIKVSPGKTQNYGKPVHLEIVMGQALREVVLECVRSPVVCPYLIHYSPKARKRTHLDAKLHWNAVTADYLTKSFA